MADASSVMREISPKLADLTADFGRWRDIG
jgi:hypothetical protein